MDFARAADLADLLAALGVIASLIFVAVELQRTVRELKRTKWETIADRFATLWSRLGNAQLADVIARGRVDYGALTPSERLMFGTYYFELCLAYEAMLVMGRDHVQGDDLSPIPPKHLLFFFGFPGVRDWWAEFAPTIGLAPIIMIAIQKAIDSCAPTRTCGPL